MIPAYMLIGALVVFGVPAAIIYLLISNASLRRRVAILEQAFASPENATPAIPVQRAGPPPLTKISETDGVGGDFHERPPLPQPDTSATASQAIVFTAVNMRKLTSWITQNWFYAVSALSLALAGVFLVIYGAEQGLLPPSIRIISALALGSGLIAAGEYIRRRYGDGKAVSTTYLPSTLSGAGIVTLFAAILAARWLYGFTGPEVTLAGMAAVGAVAMVLGWFYGPFLAAVGILGAMAAPFVIGGSSEDPSGLYAYFAVVTVMGLAIDTFRHWAWVSVLALIAGFASGWLLSVGAGAIVSISFVLYLAVLSFAAITIPVRSLKPDHQGALLSMSILARSEGAAWPEFPARLAGAVILAASLLILHTTLETSDQSLFWVAVLTLTALTMALIVWARNAPALADLIALPAAALLAIVWSSSRVWRSVVSASQVPGNELILMPTIIVAIGLLVSIAAAWRSLRGGPAYQFAAAFAALFAPVLAVIIEVQWQPAHSIGAYPWALHAMVIGAAMVLIAYRFARQDGPEDRSRVSFAVLSALACIAFGMVVILTSAALTIALAVTVVAAAWLDRQYSLPLMGTYILAGVAAIGYRLVADPGLGWALDAPIMEVLPTYLIAFTAFAVSWVFMTSINRPRSEVILESASISSFGLLLSVALYRFLLHWTGLPSAGESHWAAGIDTAIWIVLGLAQLRRLQLGGPLRSVRIGMAVIFFTIAFIRFAVALVFSNPISVYIDDQVIGPVLLNTLMPAYLLPALALLLGAIWLKDLQSVLRKALMILAGALATFWVTMTIRHGWRGAEDMASVSASQGELYTYTVAIMIVGAAAFYQSLARRSVNLRRAGLIIIGLAVAKVFFIDIGELDGLTRVFALLFLGLTLAALAWLNRWANGHDPQLKHQPDDKEPADTSDRSP